MVNSWFGLVVWDSPLGHYAEFQEIIEVVFYSGLFHYWELFLLLLRSILWTMICDQIYPIFFGQRKNETFPTTKNTKKTTKKRRLQKNLGHQPDRQKNSFILIIDLLKGGWFPCCKSLHPVILITQVAWWHGPPLESPPSGWKRVGGRMGST